KYLPDRWHQDVVDEGRDDFAEGGTDDDADRQIQHVAAHYEGFEFFEHSVSLVQRSGVRGCPGCYRKGLPVAGIISKGHRARSGFARIFDVTACGCRSAAASVDARPELS